MVSSSLSDCGWEGRSTLPVANHKGRTKGPVEAPWPCGEDMATSDFEDCVGVYLHNAPFAEVRFAKRRSVGQKRDRVRRPRRQPRAVRGSSDRLRYGQHLA